MHITVYGRPITQGSMIRTRWAMRSSNGATLAPWRDNVRAAAINHKDVFGEAAVTVTIVFTFARPKGHFGTGRNARILNGSALPYPSSHAIGDIDKLTRACLDALTDAGVWNDDSQVVDLRARKVFVREGGALDKPGAVIRVEAA
jgi:crossover junction endodeoxyribonuclease RusA